LTSFIVHQELAEGDIGLAATFAQTSELARLLFNDALTSSQRDRWLPRFLTDHQYHIASTEWPWDPLAGGLNYHRPFVVEESIGISAQQRDDGDWVLDGGCPFVPNAPVAQLYVVQARGPNPPTERVDQHIFLVDREAAGLSVQELNGEVDSLADTGSRTWFHGRAGRVKLDAVRVSSDSRIDVARLSSAWRGSGRCTGRSLRDALNLGVGRAAYEEALEYAKVRVQGGRRIIEHEAVGTILADIAIRLEVATNMAWKTAWSADHPEHEASSRGLPLPSVSKVYISQAVYEATLLAAECFGAMGVMRDMSMPHHVHAARLFLTEFSNSTAKLEVAEAIAEYQR